MSKGFWDPNGTSLYALLVALGQSPAALMILALGAFLLYFAFH
jgi:hypothetical protein